MRSAARLPEGGVLERAITNCQVPLGRPDSSTGRLVTVLSSATAPRKSPLGQKISRLKSVRTRCETKDSCTLKTKPPVAPRKPPICTVYVPLTVSLKKRTSGFVVESSNATSTPLGSKRNGDVGDWIRAGRIGIGCDGYNLA